MLLTSNKHSKLSFCIFNLSFICFCVPDNMQVLWIIGMKCYILNKKCSESHIRSSDLINRMILKQCLRKMFYYALQKGTFIQDPEGKRKEENFPGGLTEELIFDNYSTKMPKALSTALYNLIILTPFLPPQPAFLRSNWHITLGIFKVYNVCFDICIIGEVIIAITLIDTVITLHSYQVFIVLRSFKSKFFANFNYAIQYS